MPAKQPDVVEKVTCPHCHHFFGLIKSDGSGPIFDGCCEDPAVFKCPMLEKLSPFQTMAPRVKRKRYKLPQFSPEGPDDLRSVGDPVAE